MAILDVCRECFMLYKAYVNGKNNMTDKRLTLLGVSISSIVAIIYCLVCL